MRQLFRALSAVLALIVIALVSALITMRFAIHGAEVRVPALAGLPLPEAVAQMHARGLESAIDGHYYSTTQAAGNVLTQSPPSGTLVRKSWHVRVAVSLGPQKASIPALEGMNQGIATITIRRVGLQVGGVAAIPYAYAPENTIVAQTPLPGATDVQGPRIGLLVAQPSPPQQPASVMPDLTGETFSQAALAIIHAGFKLAPLQTPTSAGTIASSGITPVAPSGAVIAQLPIAGSRILAGATVQLTVQP